MLKKLKPRKPILLALGFALLLSACAKTNDVMVTDSDMESISTQSGEYRDTLNIAVTAQPPTLDTPTTVSNLTFSIGGHIFEPLYTINENYEFVPELAETVQISDDRLTYTFPLKRGVKFHNGKEMTADDVVASMNRWLTASSRARTLLEGARFEKVDDYTVKLVVTEAVSDILLILSSRSQFGAILPKEIIDSAPPEGISEYIGTGPYKLEEWRQDQYIHLVRNDDYREIDAEPSGYSGRKDRPTENIYFYFVPDHSTRVAGIRTGEYDIAESIPFESYEEVANSESINVYSRTSGVLNLFFNTTDGLLEDIGYRHAIMAAFNMEEIMLASYSSPDNFVLHNGYMDISQPQWSTDAGKEYYNQNDPERAKELLEELGYNGEVIRLLTTMDYREMYTATLVIQEQLRQIGVNAEVLNFDFPTFLETKNDTSRWDIFITNNAYGLSPVQLSVLNPEWAGFTDDRVDQGISDIRSAINQEEAKEEWEKLQAFIFEQAAATPLGHYKSITATSNKVEGFVHFELSPVWNVRVAR